jgi:hypothetical protein
MVLAILIPPCIALKIKNSRAYELRHKAANKKELRIIRIVDRLDSKFFI